MNVVLAVLIAVICCALGWAWDDLRNSVEVGRPDTPAESTPQPA